jgi:predicted O-methyltransferase YrrM
MIERLPHKAHILELGTYKGKSFSYLLIEAINSGKDISVTGLDGFGWEDVRPAFDGFMKPFEKHYNVFKGNAVDLAPYFTDQSLDFVFIDLSHTYEDTLREIRTYLPKIKPGGIIAGHDYHPEWPGVIKAVNEAFHGDYKFDWAEVIWYKEIQ